MSLTVTKEHVRVGPNSTHVGKGELRNAERTRRCCQAQQLSPAELQPRRLLRTAEKVSPSYPSIPTSRANARYSSFSNVLLQ